MEPGRGPSRGVLPVVIAFAVVVGAVWLVGSLGPFAPAGSPEPSEPPRPTEPPARTSSARVESARLLPERAAFVTSRYAVCYQGLRRPIEPSRILAWLPTSVRDVLRATAVDAGSVGRRDPRFTGGCSNLAAASARAVVAVLGANGIGPGERSRTRGGLIFSVEPGGDVWNEIAIRFEPIPLQRRGCSGCG